MLIDLGFEVEFGDIIIDSKCKHYLVVENIFSQKPHVTIIDLVTSKVYDEFLSLDDVITEMEIIGIIKRDEVILRRKQRA